MTQDLLYIPPDLDELDLIIIRELELDGRISYRALASKLGISQPTARRRVNQLVDQGAITFAAIPAYYALGYGTMLTLAIKVAPGTVNTIADQLASVDSIKYVWITAGHHDILAVAIYRNIEEYVKVFPKDIGDIPANIRIETMLTAKVIKRSWTHLADNDVAFIDPQIQYVPTELDLLVIRGLEESPRVPVKKLGKDIGASRSIVGSSLNRLISQGVIRVVGVTDPATFGYSISGVTLIQVHPPMLNTLTDKLKAHPSVRQIAMTVGTFNCIIWSTFQNSNQMYNFLAQDMGNMPGVVHYESLVTLSNRKRDFNLFGRNQGGVKSSL